MNAYDDILQMCDVYMYTCRYTAIDDYDYDDAQRQSSFASEEIRCHLLISIRFKLQISSFSFDYLIFDD